MCSSNFAASFPTSSRTAGKSLTRAWSSRATFSPCQRRKSQVTGWETELASLHLIKGILWNVFCVWNFSCRRVCSCTHCDAVLFAGSVVAFPQVCGWALALHFPPAQLLLQLLGFGQLLSQSRTFIAHTATQQAGNLRWDPQRDFISLKNAIHGSFSFL